MSSFLEQINEGESQKKQVTNAHTPIRITEHQVEVDGSYKKKKRRKVAISLIIVCLILALGSFAIKQWMKVELPNFEGKTKAQMQQWCAENNMNYSETASYSMEVEEDFVITQSINPGQRVVKKTTIEATVSKGADPEEKIEVPDFSTMKAAEIKNWIKDQKLTGVQLKEEASSTVERGMMIGYEFQGVGVEASSFTRKDSLIITMSAGKKVEESKKIPDLTNKTQEEVKEWAEKNKIKVRFQEERSDTVAEQKVISQSIEEGNIIENEQEVVVTISAGPGIEVPDFSKQSKEEAPEASTELRVAVKMKYSEKVKFGGFISQSTAAGAKVLPKDNTIIVTYSAGKPYIPQLIGRSESELPEMFYEFNQKGVNFTYQVTYVTSSEPKGMIIKATKNAEYVGMKENIGIEVSKGE